MAMQWDMQQKGKRKEKKMILRGIRTTHLLLSGQMSYPVRLEGHQNERLASECIITDANRGKQRISRLRDFNNRDFKFSEDFKKTTKLHETS